MTKTIKRNKGNFHNFIEAVKAEKDSSNSNQIFINDFWSASNDVFHIPENDYKLEDIILPEDIEEQIRNIAFEHQDKDFFQELGFTTSNKIILYGNPWCGKTKLAYIFSNLLNRELKIVNLSKLVSSHLWETNSNLSNIFTKYGSAQYVLFIDEFDIIGRLRGDTNNDHNEMKRIVNTLLQLIDFLPKDAFIIFATNDVDIIDKALMRRIDLRLELPLPTDKLIIKYLKYRLKSYKKFLWSIDYKKLSKFFEWFSYSDIEKSVEKTLKKELIEYRRSDTKEAFLINTDKFIASID